MTKICVQCGKEFTPYRDKQRFCSSNCKDAFYNAKRSVPKKDYWHKKCVVCGKEFSTPYGQRRCCSKECAAVRYLASKKKYNAKIHALRPVVKKEKKKKITIPKFYKKQCINCGETFQQSFCNEKFCSDQCRIDYWGLG